MQAMMTESVVQKIYFNLILLKSNEHRTIKQLEWMYLLTK